MRKTDMAIFDIADIARAIGFLTRLPVRVDGQAAQERGAAVVWAYPIAGLVVGGLVALTLWMGGLIGLPASISAAFGVAVGVFVTGALHEDGLADTVDGFWGGWEPARRLEIMKDSQIGTYGVLSLVLILLLRWQGFAHIDALAPVIIIAAASRAMMPPLMRLPNARGSGVSATVGRPEMTPVWIALALGTIMMLSFGAAGIICLIVMAVVAAGMAALAKAKIGGQTGDVLGATQQVTEVAGLATLVALGL